MIIRRKCILICFLFMISVIFSACSTLLMPPILKATDKRQVKKVERMLKNGVEADTPSRKGMTPLFLASLKGYSRIAKALIENGADVNASITDTVKHDGQKLAKWSTPLMASLWNKKIKISNMLINNNADVTRFDDNGVGALFIASMQKNQQIVSTLIAKGADINAASITAFEYEEKTVLAGTTPLMAALAAKQNTNAIILMNHDASVTAISSNGTDALMIAAENSGAGTVKRLLEKGADLNSKLTEDIPVEGSIHPIFEGTNALMMAAAAGETDSINEMIKAGADVAAVNRFGETALMAACAEGHLAAAELLVANGADVNARTTDGLVSGAHSHLPKGRSTLVIAVEDGHVDVVKFLIKKGADVNDKDDVLHMDALFRAARNGHVAVAKILIDAGADLYAENRKGGTALTAAKHYGNRYIEEYILKARKIALQKQKEEEEKQAEK